ncbi:nuclear transport factor 2 family protein [Sphingomonas sp. ERG5]|uniref:nuclear transport factor 2 family protein n=1 Tax=Sphingomonas sp. ERG5 TaxID=1381597 RepID=UPI00054AFFB6|nr:nuclear transport factor 2 family protein [Sphingomonas sp. ERG5]
MPSSERVESFIALVEAGSYVTALEEYYAETASAQENGDTPRTGRDALIAAERRTLSLHREIRANRLAAPSIDGDRVAIAWRFEFVAQDGSTRAMEEIAWQLWSGDRIIEERFFYDPRQLAARTDA